MSQENESNIQVHINTVEELYNSSRVSTEKKLNKISKQLDALDMIVRKVNKKKEKGKDVKGFDKVCEFKFSAARFYLSESFIPSEFLRLRQKLAIFPASLKKTTKS